ncbi:MAG TPA: M28 family peptidase [Solirubrobacteraceae bacterium]|nr:M28 family peptidase [Solirubrobacteraceae bacterium]
MTRALTYEPRLDAIRRDVATLAGMTRSSARPGEWESAAWLARRLEAAGASEVAVHRYRYQHSYALAHALHNLAGMAACRLGGLRGATLAAATLYSYEREVSGRCQWLRGRLPGAVGANVTARIPAAGSKRASLVLVAHHDAANTGWVWNPRLVAAGGSRHVRRRRVDPFMAPLGAALDLAVVGGLLPRRSQPGRAARVAAAAVLAAGTAADADVGRSPTVPGASDNATGVAVCLDLAAAVARAPLSGVEIRIVLPGSEEAGMGGMAAFLDSEDGTRLQPRSAFVLGLDTLGAGRPIVCTGEGAIREHRYHEADVRLVEEGAALVDEPLPARWRIGAWTDPILAVHRGLPAACLLSMGPGYFPHYHHPSDTAENVDWDSVARCARIAGGVVSAYARLGGNR